MTQLPTTGGDAPALSTAASLNLSLLPQSTLPSSPPAGLPKAPSRSITARASTPVIIPAYTSTNTKVLAVLLMYTQQSLCSACDALRHGEGKVQAVVYQMSSCAFAEATR